MPYLRDLKGIPSHRLPRQPALHVPFLVRKDVPPQDSHPGRAHRLGPQQAACRSGLAVCGSLASAADDGTPALSALNRLRDRWQLTAKRAQGEGDVLAEHTNEHEFVLQGCMLPCCALEGSAAAVHRSGLAEPATLITPGPGITRFFGRTESCLLRVFLPDASRKGRL